MNSRYTAPAVMPPLQQGGAFVLCPLVSLAKTPAAAWCGRPLARHLPLRHRLEKVRLPIAPRCEVAAPQPESADESLDEAAMRAAEIHEVLQGLEDFKARIVDDATKLAKKVRAPKKELEKALETHPDIVKIDGHIAQLNEELKALGDR